MTTTETKKVICTRCENEIEGDVYYDEDGNAFCEDCYYKLIYMFA